MNKQWLILMLISLIGCKDKPYQENSANLDVAIKELAVINGIVELGTPVRGALVSAYTFNKLKKGEKLAQGISSDDGRFSLNIAADHQGPVMLVASGGTYKDLVTLDITSIKPDQELSTALTHVNIPETININAWTTLAMARVIAKQGFWDKSVADLGDNERIHIDFAHLSYFLTGKSNRTLAIQRQDFFDLEKEELNLRDPRVALHVSHGGLSYLAKNYADKLRSEGATVTVIDLISALSQDLSDRIFDGKNSNSSMVFVGNNRRINLTSLTMRKDFAEAIYHYAQNLVSVHKLTEDDLLELRSVGNLIDSIATATHPELFPDTQTPKPIDIDVPKIEIRFLGKHKNEHAFAVLDGDVYFKINAHHKEQIAHINVLSPALEKNAEDQSFGPLSIEHEQNSMEIAIACNKREEFSSNLKMRNLKREDVFCACFEAIDSSGNTQRELSCFQREKPRVSIRSPRDHTTYARADLQDGIKIEAVIDSGVAVLECFWSAYGQREVALLKGEGKILGTKCVIAENIAKDRLPSGDYTLLVQATDIAHRTPSNGYMANFTVRHDLVHLPPGRIIIPQQ